LYEAAVAAVGDKKFTLSVSNRSSGGKYHSLNLELMVDNESERRRIYKHLNNNTVIKIVL
jgi:putative lipoic acid-binding regulatory protein